MDSAGSDRPQRRLFLEENLADTGKRYLSETHFGEDGENQEVGAGYTLFWSGRKRDERREAGVGFAIKSDLAIAKRH